MFKGYRHPKRWLPWLTLVAISSLVYHESSRLLHPELDAKQVKSSNEIMNTTIAQDKGVTEADKPRQHVVPEIHVKNISCPKINGGDENEIKMAAVLTKRFPWKGIGDAGFITKAANCQSFLSYRQYITHPLTQEESDFPLAYTIMMYKNVEQVEKLLRVIYRPQNYYCFHIDKKSKPVVKDAMLAITKCFNNVFISSRSVAVKWGTYSQIEAELICMDDLLKFKKWKYYINLTGQEFPLKTNWELVNILKVLNGSNIISANKKGTNIRRTKWTFKGLAFQNKLNAPIPHNMTAIKGPVAVCATHDFVHYVIKDPKAVIFRQWVQRTANPDETFFTSLNHNPHLRVPGSYKGVPEFTTSHPHIQRYVVWGGQAKCSGKHVRSVCVFGVRDLPRMFKSDKLFVNKFYIDYEPYALQCLEHELLRRVKAEVDGQRTFDVSYYKGLEYTWNHIPSSLNTVK